MSCPSVRLGFDFFDFEVEVVAPRLAAAAGWKMDLGELAVAHTQIEAVVDVKEGEHESSLYREMSILRS